MPAIRMILEAAAEPPSVRGLTALALRRRLAGAPTLLRWSGAVDGRRAAVVLRRRRHQRPRGDVRPDGVGDLAGDARHGLGALGLRDASRRPGSGGRSAAAARCRAPCDRRSRLRAARCGRRASVDSIRCEGDRVRGVGLVDGTEIDAPIVVSACNPHDTFLRWLKNPPPTAPTISSGAGRTSRMPKATSRSSTSIVDARPAASRLRPHARADHDDRSRPGRHRPGRGADGRGPGARPAGHARQRPDACSTRRWRPPAGTCSASRSCSPRSPSWVGGRIRPSRGAGWKPCRSCCEPGFLDSIVDWRAMTPDVYERDFHLPAGHATSFAGGPLAAFRNANPELTNYETAVAGPLPHRRGDLPGRRRLGRERPQLRHRHPRTPVLMVAEVLKIDGLTRKMP